MPWVTATTALGSFRFRMDPERAPATCEYFLSVFRSGVYEDASVFRIVAPRNHRQSEPNPIEVVQLGPRGCIETEHVYVPHESTEVTGIKHRRGTVSAARVRLSHLFGSFFVCMRDEPALDFGAGRHPDRQGFAAFGQVETGFGALERIMERAETDDFLQREIPIISLALESSDESSGR